MFRKGVRRLISSSSGSIIKSMEPFRFQPADRPTAGLKVNGLPLQTEFTYYSREAEKPKEMRLVPLEIRARLRCN